MQSLRAYLVLFAACAAIAGAQTADTKQRVKAVRELGKLGSESIPKIEPYLTDAAPEVRAEAVRSIVEIGTGRSIDPLINATRDNDPEVQIRATEGLVNFYSPGYVKQGGISGSLKRAGSAIRSKFTDTNDLIIDPWIQVRPEVISALGKLARGGASMDSRATAARALGILRGRAALEDLYSALRTKDDAVLRESLIAIQKIHDESAGPRVIFLIRDLNESVQIPAIETVGVLRTKEAIPDLKDVLTRARSAKVRRSALGAMAMIPDPSCRELYVQYLTDKDEGLRAGAAEGFARLKQTADLPLVNKAFESETKMSPRLSMAFAAVSLGRNDLGEFSPLRYLVNALNSSGYRGVAQPFLTELSRDAGVRRTLYPVLSGATRDEKIYLGQVLARTGDQETVQYLDAMTKDPDTAVAEQGLRSLKALRARL
ncbi:MAG: HEAT repeat domain-containing protein [Acidobacteria bacterium]|nr:HEAT repeat domain-containing protein [Acidobacteriota bacterium]